MAGRPTLAWRREHPHERLVMAYTDAYTNLGIAYSERPPFGAKTDSEEVRQFLEKLTRANLSLRLLRVLCREPVRPTIDAAIKEVDQAVRAPITETFYRNPSAWLIASIDCVKRRLDVMCSSFSASSNSGVRRWPQRPAVCGVYVYGEDDLQKK